MGRITVATLIGAPRDLCFDLALDVNVHAQSASFSGERLIPPGKMSGVLAEGDLVAFEGKHFGLRHRFVAQITKIVRPDFFIDEMIEGTFVWLRHEHRFEESGPAGTKMVDELEWKAPFGPIGRIADWLFLERHMRNFVERKQSSLAHIAAARFQKEEAHDD